MPWAESSAERSRFSGGRDSETGSSGGTHVAPSERWRSGWDHEFESPLLQRRVNELSVPVAMRPETAQGTIVADFRHQAD
jgi:hypothetical protein